MGAEAATELAAPSGPLTEADGDRVGRRRRIGELVELYEELERVLAAIDERELRRLAARTQHDERPLAFWARRVARARGVALRGQLDMLASRRAGRSRIAFRAKSLVWEAVAFVVGFGVSLLLIAGGA